MIDLFQVFIQMLGGFAGQNLLFWRRCTTFIRFKLVEQKALCMKGPRKSYLE